MPDVRLSAAGRLELEADLERLEDERKQVAASIQQAREQGNDPTENLALRDALERLAQIEGRISELRAVLARAEPLEAGADSGRARLGATVTIRLSRGEEATYVLVSPQEAAPRRGRLSIESPIGAALVGATVGDEV